jgi:hypothetical protein
LGYGLEQLIARHGLLKKRLVAEGASQREAFVAKVPRHPDYRDRRKPPTHLLT